MIVKEKEFNLEVDNVSTEILSSLPEEVESNVRDTNGSLPDEELEAMLHSFISNVCQSLVSFFSRPN